MKVFMSWSGKRSHEVAKMFHQWIKCVIQATEPWLSSDAIESGSVWFSTCLDSWDHVPRRSWPLFKARHVLRTLFRPDLSLVA
jgi:hypothetical protein